MKIVGTLIGIVLLLIGGLWILQGANIVGGSFMSGQSQWLYTGIVAAAVGLILLYWSFRSAQSARNP